MALSRLIIIAVQIEIDLFNEVLLYGSIIALLIIMGILAIFWAKNNFDPRGLSNGDSDNVMSIEQLEKIYQRGMMSFEEFDVLRKRLIADVMAGEKNDEISTSEGIIDDREKITSLWNEQEESDKDTDDQTMDRKNT